MKEVIRFPNRRNPVAVQLLAKLIEPAAVQLTAFGQSPCLIAEAPDKFNDAYNDDYWYAVQVGETTWEQSHFFADSSHTRVVEQSTSVDGIGAERRERMGPESFDPIITEARRMLHDLQKAGWRSTFADAVDSHGEILSLVFQYNQIWLVQSSARDDDGHIWVKNEKKDLTYFGTTIRLDGEVGRPAPLVFNQVVPGAIEHISTTARAQFDPKVQDGDAHKTFTEIITVAAREAAKITSAPLTLVSKGSRYNLYCGSVMQHHIYDRGGVVWKNYQEYALKPCSRMAVTDRRQRNKHPKEVYALSTLVGLLEDADWRGLFGKAFGIELVLNDVLALFVGPSYAILVRNNTAFLVEDDQLDFIGICDYPNCFDPETPP